jgi:hypothetical protein
MRGSKSWLVPLTGAGFIVLAIVGFAVSGSPPDANSPLPDIVDHYASNKGRIEFGTLVLTAATLLLVYFGSYLRSVLRRAPGENGMLADVAFAGTVVFAVGGAIDSMFSFVLAESAEDLDPTAVQGLQAVWDNDWMPLALGVELFILSCGLSIVLHRSLPAWLGWSAIVIAVVGLTPIGFVAFVATGVWVLVTSIMLTMQGRNRVIELPGGETDTVTMPTQGAVPDAEHRHGLGRLHRGKVDH